MRYALLILLAATAVPALVGQDQSAADAIWAAAEAEAGDDPSARIWVDAARVNAAVAPWQPGFATAQSRVHEVDRRRRAELPNDRGGRRRPLELTP